MKHNTNAAESGTLTDVFDREAWHPTRIGFTEDQCEAARVRGKATFKGR